MNNPNTQDRPTAGRPSNDRPPAGWQIRLICEVLEAPRSAFGSMDGAVAWINSLADLEAEETEA